MERRIRLTWSAKHGRPWCPGTTRPARQPRFVASGWTGFFKVQGLVDLIRHKAAERESDELLDSLPPATPAAPAETRDDSPARG